MYSGRNFDFTVRGYPGSWPCPVNQTNLHFLTSDLSCEWGAHVLQTLLLTDMKSTLSTELNRGDNYHQRLKAVFTAPVTGNYSFWVSSDDQANVYVSDLQENSASSSTMVIDFNGYCIDFMSRPGINGWLWCPDSQRSAPMLLQEGHDYVIQAEHAEGWGYDFFTLGLIVPGTEPSYNSKREIERLDISATVQFEKQKVDIPVTSPVESGFYILYWEYVDANGFSSTQQINMDATKHGNTSYLSQQLSFLGPIQVTLCTSAASNGLCYQVEMLSLVPSQRDLLEVRFAADLIVCTSSCGLTVNAVYYATREVTGDASIGGTFTINYGPLSTSEIQWGAEASAVAGALKNADGFPGGVFYVVRNVRSATQLQYDVEFVGHRGPIYSSLELNITKLSGGTSITATTTIVQEGSFDKLLAPIPSYMLFTVETTPQVHVYSDGHIASCNVTDSSGRIASCPFTPSEVLTPVITAVDEFYGPDGLEDPTAARVLVIYGYGFSDDMDGNLVTVAGEICRPMSAEPTSVTCALTRVVTGKNEIILTVLDKGLARHEGDYAPYYIVGTLSIHSVSPVIGSVGGGTYITITGAVFPQNDPSLVSITFEEALNSGETTTQAVPSLESITFDTIVFKSPANTELKSEYDNVVLNVAGQKYEFAFGYDAALSPLITSVTPDLVSAVEPTLLTITGQGLGSSAKEVEITLAGDKCVVRSISPTLTTCMWYPMDNSQLINCDVQCERLVDGVARTTHDLNYNVMGKGLSVGVPGSLSIRVALEINSVTPDRGSLYGGTMVTVRGAGFGYGSNFPTTVSIGTDFPASLCAVTFVNISYLECVTRTVAMYDMEIYQDVEATIRNVPTECKYIPYVPPPTTASADEGTIYGLAVTTTAKVGSVFYGLESDGPTAPAPPSPPPEVLPDLGSLSAAPPPPPNPPSPPLYEPAYKTLTYYGIGEVVVELARTGPQGNYPFYGISQEDSSGTLPAIEQEFPGVYPWQPPPPPDTSSRRRLLSVDEDGADGDFSLYGMIGLGPEAATEEQSLPSLTPASPPPPPPPPSPPPPLVFPPPPPFVPTSGDCRFIFSEAYTPVVSSVSPSPVTNSEVLVVTGSNFDASTDKTKVEVYFVKVAGASDEPSTLYFESQVL